MAGFLAGLPGGAAGRRLIRAGLTLLLGWIALEAALLSLVAERIGWGLTVAILSVKGAIGLLLLGYLAYRGFMVLRRPEDVGGWLKASVKSGFGVASAVLISIPGFVPACIGIALFSPSVQLRVLRVLRQSEGRQSPREIDLPAGAYREIRTRRPRKKVTKRESAPMPRPSLERKPPSV